VPASASLAPSSIATLLGAPYCTADSVAYRVTGGYVYDPARGCAGFHGLPDCNRTAIGARWCACGAALAASQLGRNARRRRKRHVNIWLRHAYGDRLYQLDFRVGKIFRFAGGRERHECRFVHLFTGTPFCRNLGLHAVNTDGGEPWRTPTRVQQEDC